MMRRIATLLLPACALLAGCHDNTGADALAPAASAALAGIVYLDANGSGTLDAGDGAFPGVTVSLRVPGGSRAIHQSRTDSLGVYRFPDVEPGRYSLALDAAAFADTVHVTVAPDTALVITPRDTAVVRVGVSFRTATVAEARALPEGRRVFTDGRVVGVYGDTLHLAGGGRAIRARRLTFAGGVATANLLGDSVRLLSTTRRDGGLPVLDPARAIVLAAKELPADTTLPTGSAGGAAEGAIDAVAARVTAATVVDTLREGTRFLVRVDDGSGPVEVVLGTGPANASAPYAPGTVLDVAGVLVPGPAAGRWRLRPRVPGDLVLRDTPSPFRPAAPTGPAARAEDSTVVVTWTDASAQETEFRVERRSAGAPAPAVVGTVGAGETRFTDASAASNTPYAYRVRACNGLVCSAPTAEVVVATVPAAPTGFGATAASRGAVLAWRDASTVETRFELERSDGGAFARVATLPANLQAFTQTGLAPGTAYTYRLRACNDAGCSPFTSAVAVTPLP